MGRAGRAPRDATAGGDIEFVAPRTELFGGTAITGGPDLDDPAHHSFADTNGETDRPARWTTALAGLGVASLLAIGVVAAAPWNEDAAPPPSSAPTTSLPGTSVPGTDLPGSQAPATTDADAPGAGPASPAGPAEDPFAIAAAGGPPVGYLLDPSILATGQVTLVDRPAAADVANDLGWTDVWATSGASSISGSWLAVEVTPWADSSSSGPLERVPVGDRVGLAGTAGALATLSVPAGDRTVVLTGSGWSPDRLVALADGIEVTGGRPVYPGGAVEGHTLVLSRTSDGRGVMSELAAQAVSTLRWMSGDGVLVEISTRPADDPDEVALRQLLVAPLAGEPYSGPGARLVVGGRVLTLGRPADGFTGVAPVQATFDERGITVTVAVTDLLARGGEVDRLLGYVDPSQLRAGTTAEWLGLEDQLVSEAGASPPGALVDELAASAELPDGSAWTTTRMSGSTAGDAFSRIDLTEPPKATAGTTPTWISVATDPDPAGS